MYQDGVDLTHRKVQRELCSDLTYYCSQDLPVKVKEYEVGRHSLFFNDTDSRKMYKNYVKAIITRENSINGRKYFEDPTLMSWSLLNEPRCETWRVSDLFTFHSQKQPYQDIWLQCWPALQVDPGQRHLTRDSRET